MGCYVPQAVVKDSTVLDVDLVLSEVVEDGELLLVEYNCGPEAYTTRYTAAQLDTQTRFLVPCGLGMCQHSVSSISDTVGNQVGLPGLAMFVSTACADGLAGGSSGPSLLCCHGMTLMRWMQQRHHPQHGCRSGTCMQRVWQR
jgi:hypothetical protein